MDVRLPDGTIIRNVPDGISTADLTAKLNNNGYDVAKLNAAAAPAGSEIPAPRAEVPAWARQYPRLYGVAGAARETLGPLLEMGGMVGGGVSDAAQAMGVPGFDPNVIADPERPGSSNTYMARNSTPTMRYLG